jgi:hypothetical protein
MLRAVTLAALLVTLSGCGESEPWDCTARMVWDGFVYEGLGEPSDPPEVGQSLGTGYTLSCATGADVRDHEVEVFAVSGVDPAEAIVVVGDGWTAQTVWRGPGRAYVEAARARQHPFLQDRSSSDGKK